MVCAADQPNILWITAKDMSATLGCYGDKYASTPNIDRLAKESVRYTKAFASAPLLSLFGFHFHRTLPTLDIFPP